MTDIVANFELQEEPTIEATFTLTGGTIYHDELLHREYYDQHPISAITDLQDALDTLQEHIDDEAETRENADEGLNEDIIAENERALEAEEALGERIDDIIDGTTHISYDNSISGLEADTIKSAIDELQSNVESETLRAETVEGDLDDLTTSEKTNLVGAINELDSSKQDNLTAGLGVDITNNEVSVTTPTLINSATGTNSLTVLGTSASQNGVTNVGVSAEGIATNATAVGYSASAEGAASTAVGKSANAHATRSIALGALSVASGDFSIAIGSHNSLHDSSARATAQSAIQLGNGTNSTADTFQVGSYTLLNTSTGIIPNARIDIDSVPTENSTNTVSSGGVYSKQGDLTTLTTTEKTDLVSAINELDSDKQENITAGTGIDITSNTVSVTDPTLVNNGTGTKALAIGKTSQSTAEGGVSVGYGSRANSTYGTAVGYESRADNTNTVAIGKSAEATQQRAIAIGSGAEANAQDAIAIKGINNTANTMQVYTYTLLDMSTGLIPNARIDIDSTPTASSTNTVSSGGTYTMVNNVITGTTDIDYDNTTSGLSANTVKGAIDELASDVDDIENLIPSEATSTNQLADKSFVNSSVSTNTAYFRGTFSSVPDLLAYSGTVTNNDYAFVINGVITDNGNDWPTFADLDLYDKSLVTNWDYAWVVNGSNFDLYRFDIVNQVWELRVSDTQKAGVSLNTLYNRYKAVVSGGTTTWEYEYSLNNSSFTSTQWAAINSGANTINIGQITTNQNAIGTLSSLTTTAQNNLVSAINELDSDKQENITGAATSIVSSDLTASKALVSDSTGKVAVSIVTSTELGYVSGVTSAIQTQLDGKVDENAAITGDTKCKITYDSKGLVTAGADLQASDIPSLTLSKISDVTASASEVNILDGVTASTAELNVLDGVTASTSEINVLDGITATTTELNYTDGVTSNIQTQLDGKQATLVSGTNIKTVNSTSLLGSGDVTVQETLVSGTNIKTINSTSILGSGDLTIDSLPSQTGHSGKYLTTDGTDASWANVDALPSQTGQSGKYLTTDGSSASWATLSVNPDNKSITTNASDELQTIGVINSRDSSTAIKTWTGTKAQYDAIVTKDANTLYEVEGYGVFLGTTQIAAGSSELNNPFSLFEFQFTDHLLNNASWLRADTFSWASGAVYVSAYEHLVDDIDNITAESETIAGYTVTFYRATDGHKICLADQESTVADIYTATGVAWYYILDTTNTRFKLPRTKFGVTGLRNNVGDYVAAGVPNITGEWGSSTVRPNNLNIQTGVFSNKTTRQTTYYNNTTANTATSDTWGLAFDASASNSIYGNSTTVQPPATQAYLYFYVGETIQDANLIAAGEVLDTLNGKADIDLTNAATSASASAKQEMFKWDTPDYSAKVDNTSAWGTELTAPSNGFVWCRSNDSTGSNNPATLTIGTTQFNVVNNSNTSGVGAGCMFRILKNQKYTASGGNGVNRALYFLPAIGG